MADIVVKGKILGHSVNEIMPSGEVTYTGIEFQKDNGEVIWLKDATMQSRCHYLFDGAMNEEETITLWLLGNSKKSWVYGVTVGNRFAYEPPAKGGAYAVALQFLIVGALSAFFLIGIPIFLAGLYILIKALTLNPQYPERIVKSGEIPAKSEGRGVEEFAKGRAAATS